jgi:molybdopterin molybdotransferase
MGPGLVHHGLVVLRLVKPGFESRSADWLGVDEALARILAGAQALGTHPAEITESLGYALAEDIVADATLPPFDNSAMDGYAVRSADVRGASGSAPVTLRVVGAIRAGEHPGSEIREGETIRIMTGAPLPPGADSVVRVEDTDGESDRDAVRILDDRDAGHNLRPAGQDMRSGERLLSSGHSITPGTVGVLAAAGRQSVLVYRRPTVAVMTTGDELRGPDRFDDVRNARGVPNSNGPMVAAAVSAAGGVPHSLANAADEPDDLRLRLAEAKEDDVLITIGGASMGEADLVKRVLDELGYQHDFWRVRMRPGSPIGFGWLPRGERLQPVFSLPGNPTSAFVTFEVLVRPFLMRLGGHSRTERRTVVCRAAEPIRTPADLTYFLRVTVEGPAGALTARLTGPQGSGLVSGLARASGLAIISEDVSGVDEGGDVRVTLID